MIDWEQGLQGLEGFEAHLVTPARGTVIDGGHMKSVIAVLSTACGNQWMGDLGGQ